MMGVWLDERTGISLLWHQMVQHINYFVILSLHTEGARLAYLEYLFKFLFKVSVILIFFFFFHVNGLVFSVIFVHRDVLRGLLLC